MAASKNSNTNSDTDSTTAMKSLDICTPTKSRRTPRQKCSEARKIRKPLMEKKRRARINQSLNELKEILLDVNSAPQKEGTRPSKLEKADILELTVTYLQSLHRKLNDSSEITISTCSQTISKSTEGVFKVETAEEVKDLSTAEIGNDQYNEDCKRPISPPEPTGKLAQWNSSFLEGFTKCSSLVESTLVKNLRKRQHEKIQRQLKVILQQHLQGLEVNSVYHHQVLSSLRDSGSSPSDSTTQMIEIVNSNEFIPNEYLKTSSTRKTYLVPTRLANGTLVFAIAHQPDSHESEPTISKDHDHDGDSPHFARISRCSSSSSSKDEGLEQDQFVTTNAATARNSEASSQLTDSKFRTYNFVNTNDTECYSKVWRPW